MNSYSQAGQDLWVAAVLQNKRDGLFLEVGTNNPVKINNTYALESQFGWRGLLVDNSPDSMLACEAHRRSPFYLTDASKPQDWIGALRMVYDYLEREQPDEFTLDYLSADIDHATLDFLKNFPFDKVRFRCVTVEHDLYRNGQAYRGDIHAIMHDNGYTLIAADVCDQGLPFESWFVHPDLTDFSKAQRFLSQGKDWREVLG